MPRISKKAKKASAAETEELLTKKMEDSSIEEIPAPVKKVKRVKAKRKVTIDPETSTKDETETKEDAASETKPHRGKQPSRKFYVVAIHRGVGEGHRAEGDGNLLTKGGGNYCGEPASAARKAASAIFRKTGVMDGEMVIEVKEKIRRITGEGKKANIARKEKARSFVYKCTSVLREKPEVILNADETERYTVYNKVTVKAYNEPRFWKEEGYKAPDPYPYVPSTETTDATGNGAGATGNGADNDKTKKTKTKKRSGKKVVAVTV